MLAGVQSIEDEGVTAFHLPNSRGFRLRLGELPLYCVQQLGLSQLS